MTHTPGPWKATIGQKSLHPIEIETEAGKPVGKADFGRNEAVANARLIAAAPDMLGALRLALIGLQSDNPTLASSRAHSAVKAAIARATQEG